MPQFPVLNVKSPKSRYLQCVCSLRDFRGNRFLLVFGLEEAACIPWPVVPFTVTRPSGPCYGHHMDISDGSLRGSLGEVPWRGY